jgi:hypothetical protein
MSKLWLMSGGARGRRRSIVQTREADFRPQAGPNFYALPVATPSSTSEPRR